MQHRGLPMKTSIKSKLFIFTSLSLAFFKSQADDTASNEYQTLDINSEIRHSVKITISEQFSQLHDLNLNGGNYIDPKLEVMLRLSGVKIDDKSKIQIYKEDNFFDLSCFNCIIRSIDIESFIQQPDNKDTL